MRYIIFFFLIFNSSSCFADTNFIGSRVMIDSIFPSPYDPYAFFVRCTLSLENNMAVDTIYVLRQDVDSFVIRDTAGVKNTAVLVVKKKPSITGGSREPVPSPLRTQIYYYGFWTANDSIPQISDSLGKWYVVAKDKPISFYKRFDLAGPDAADLRTYFLDGKKLKLKDFRARIRCRVKDKKSDFDMFLLEIPSNKLSGLLR
jgi:hypothetical protein